MSDADNSLPPSGQTLIQALRSLVTTLDARSIRYAIIGRVATIQHTRVRTTGFGYYHIGFPIVQEP